MALDITKFIGRFVEEARDHIDTLNRGLMELEKHPEGRESIDAVFRAAHTIKGSSRMLKLTAITDVAHKLEDVLAALREKRILLTKELSGLLFNSADTLAAMVENLSSGKGCEQDNSVLCEALSRAADGSVQPGPEAAPTEEHTAPKEQQQIPSAQSETIKVRYEKLDDLIRLMGEVVSYQNKLKQRLADLSAAELKARQMLETCTGLCDGTALPLARALHADLKQLLSVMKQDKSMQEILTAEFQEKALMLRMVPLAAVFDPLQRMVRDMAATLGKELDFEIQGSDIELDKQMIEKLRDPLLHMVRNAIDHGIEKAETRRDRGKPARGRLALSAVYDAGTILIELSDDGAGISTSKIREKVLAKKLIEPAVLDSMSEAALFDLIFMPGFSTSDIITDISGRGVGMDVVRKNLVEDLKGTVHITSREGAGSTFSLRLPMTLAIMRILLISCGGMKFGVTTHYVGEIVKVAAADIIDVVGRKALRLREEFIPVSDMQELLRVSGKSGQRTGDVLVMIVQISAEKMGFIIESLLDEEDMVIKSLPEHMKNIRLVSGVTITGRNEIVNILNMPAVMEAARAMGPARQSTAEAEPPGRQKSILVVDDSVNTRDIEKSILESYGYGVSIAADGMEALRMTGEARYDLVITDVEMPLLDGFSLTERLRADASYKDVPIIIVTSREKDEDKRRGIRIGANAYIVKGSFDQSNLVDTVSNLIGKGAVQ